MFFVFFKRIKGPVSTSQVKSHRDLMFIEVGVVGKGKRKGGVCVWWVLVCGF